MVERQPHQSVPPPDETQPRQGRAEGRQSLQGPTTVNRSEQPQSQQESTLSRAVERTRDLYERNGCVFLPLGETGEHSPDIPTLQGEQQPQSGGLNLPEPNPLPELPLPFEPNPSRPEQQTGDLDPEIETLLQAASLGDPEYEKSLREQYQNDPSFREYFDRFRRGGRGAGTLTRRSPDFYRLLKKQENQE